MKFSHRILVAIGLLLLPLLIGCGTQPPTEEPKVAKDAMEQAKSVQADRLAALDWGNALQKYNDAELMMKKNRYADAKTFYLQAKARFEKAYTVGKAKRDGLMKDVDEKRTMIGTTYGKVKTMMAKAPAKVRKDAEASCMDIDKGIADVDKAVQEGDVIKAKLTSDDILKKVVDTARTLETGGKK